MSAENPLPEDITVERVLHGGEKSENTRYTLKDSMPVDDRIGLDFKGIASSELPPLQSIREINLNDPAEMLGQLVDMYHHTNNFRRFNMPPNNVNEFLQMLKKSRGKLCVYTLPSEKGDVIGTFSLIRKSKTEVESSRMGVYPKYHGLGVGTRLLEDMLHLVFEEQSYQKITAKTAVKMSLHPTTLDAYAYISLLSHGFEPVRKYMKDKIFSKQAIFPGNLFEVIGEPTPPIREVAIVRLNPHKDPILNENPLNQPVGLKLVQYTDSSGSTHVVTELYSVASEVDVVEMALTRENYLLWKNTGLPHLKNL